MRKTARENAFKLIFESLINEEEPSLSYEELTSELTGDDREFFDALTGGVRAERSFLTDVITRFSDGFTADRVYKIDLALLLMASYEILFMPDVPDKVSVNEAVELAKEYSTDNSPAFINGVLASVIRNKEEILYARNED